MNAEGVPARRLKILHFAFEDPQRPGSGGGSMRSHIVNSHLACRHDVTAVVARYPGARARDEDGVQYRPIGLPIGRFLPISHFLSMAAYHLAVPWYLIRHRADIIVEDFAAPHSSNLVPVLSAGRPTVAVVQYLFAREKSRQYHLPFWRIEVAGVQSFERLISVSDHIGARLRELNATATVDVIHAGVTAPKGAPAEHNRPPRLLFLGRLEWDMKGLDLLVEVIDRVSRERRDVILRIAGDGPHESRLRKLIEQRGLGGYVEWLGRVHGDAKWTALRDAMVVVMPSRFETFGMVALEAMAVGTPVVGFAIPTLQEIVAHSGGGVLVGQEDVEAMAKAVITLIDEPEQWANVSHAALVRASEFDWEAAAHQQEIVYVNVVDRFRPRRGAHRRSAARAVRAIVRPRFADGRRIPSPITNRRRG